ncbi:MAG: 50S ribosomal protein L11 methyltransferase [Nevskia sp.]|nr:50S ribosomal protein L11 methyltransferase [Nevskia sp.]
MRSAPRRKLAAPRWLELSLVCHRPEFAEELLFAHGAAAVTFVDAADDPVLEPRPGETPLWPRTRVRGLFCAAADLAAVRAALRAQLPDEPHLEFAEREVQDADWLEAWRQHAQPLRFGTRLWVVPGGHRVAQNDAVVVQLDPGLAFGTGAHPSTALCLEWLAGQKLAGRRVLDYGCGSGILAIAALKLGAAHALAVDLDPQALLAARENARRNAVSARLSCATPEQCMEEAVDIVLANILARPLIELAPRLARATRAGGRIALSGLLLHQADEVRAAYAPWFDCAPGATREEWVRIEGVRNSASTM